MLPKLRYAVARPNAAQRSRNNHLDIVLVLHVPNAVLGDDLDKHTFEVDRKPPLQLLGAHSEDLHALLEIDVGMVVLIEKRETIVPDKR